MSLQKRLAIWMIASVMGASLFGESRAMLGFETPAERGNEVGLSSGMVCKAVMTNASISVSNTTSCRALTVGTNAQARISRAAAARAKMLDRLRADASRAGRDTTALLLASATPMEKVRPQDVREFRRAEELGVRLAQGETEAVQLLVLPERNVCNLRVEAGALARTGDTNGPLPSKCVTVAPVGYVKTDVVPKYASNAGFGRLAYFWAGWHPDPILTFTNAVNVRKGAWQSFWISVRCPRGQAAGVYRGG